MTSIPELYTQNFYEVARAVSDHHGRDEMGVTEFAVKYFSNLYIEAHREQFDVKQGGDVVYLGGPDAKIEIPEGYDEDDPIDEFDQEDGYSEVPEDAEPLDFEIEDVPSKPDDGEADTTTDDTVDGENNDDDDPDSDDSEESEKMTFSMSEGPPSSD